MEGMKIKNIHTVSLARSSGSSRPLDCLYNSRSQHLTREAKNPPMHCNMISLDNQNTPCLINRSCI